MTKPREWWLLGYEEIGKYSHAYAEPSLEPSIKEQMIHVREVLPSDPEEIYTQYEIDSCQKCENCEIIRAENVKAR